MIEISYTLLSDGSSDRALIWILTALLQEHVPACRIAPQWADLRHCKKPCKNLSERIIASLRYYPCDLLCIHRDAENITYQERCEEIRKAVADLDRGVSAPPYVCVVPVRMMEAWLLFDEKSIRHAAGNPRGSMPLNLPSLQSLEQEKDPKKALLGAIETASGLLPGRRNRLNAHERVHRLASFIQDFTPLRKLPAFADLDNQIRHFAETVTKRS